MTPSEAEAAAIARWFKLGQRTESIVILGGWQQPRPRRCPMCGGRYTALNITRGLTKLGRCPGPHAMHRRKQ